MSFVLLNYPEIPNGWILGNKKPDAGYPISGLSKGLEFERLSVFIER
tara:strand:- start:71 stop:211 length:141 start_codon:yes stop_codon:yes gene_type:complete